ncbi:MAG: oxidoreductase, partial [Mycobacterium sp.]|nr:oxidoreductase [Mycobacterium sp.]
MSDRLAGKVIVVAGAGGIGDALARRYAAEGAQVLLGDLDTARAVGVAEEITSTGGDAVGTHLDGADDDSVAELVALAVSKFGAVNGFHANYANFAD